VVILTRAAAKIVVRAMELATILPERSFVVVMTAISVINATSAQMITRTMTTMEVVCLAVVCFLINVEITVAVRIPAVLSIVTVSKAMGEHIVIAVRKITRTRMAMEVVYQVVRFQRWSVINMVTVMTARVRSNVPAIPDIKVKYVTSVAMNTKIVMQMVPVFPAVKQPNWNVLSMENVAMLMD
jgi:hypothetical protein